MVQRLTKAALAASPNVIRLPTAAKRKVEQRYNKHFRAVVPAMREKWPGRFIHPQTRAKISDAAALLHLERTPELLLAIAIFEALGEEQKKQVRAQCEMLKFTGTSARAAAVAIQVRTIGEQYYLDAAMKLLREGL